VLNPKCKLVHFTIAGWEIIWIEEAKKLVYDMYNSKYAPTAAATDQEPIAEITQVSVHTIDVIDARH
jgi:hypothetical protein